MYKEFNLTAYINSITGQARVDLNGNFIYVNQKYCDLTGYAVNELLGQNTCIMKHPERDSFIIEKLWNTIQAGNEYHCTFPDLTKTGQTIYIEKNIFPIKDSDGYISEYFVLSFDVTEAKKQEAMMSHSSRAAALGEMVGNIAHQWRQPLATVSAIMTELEFYQELGELTDEIQAEAFGRISSSISYLSNTIDDFRSFFHGDKTVAMIPLHETISLAISIVEHSFEKLGIALIVQDESMNSNVAINVNEFSQVLINILNNARDVFSDRGTNNPTVKIILGAEKENNFIKIQDNAGGIGSDIITKIFDPYFTTKHQSQGTGLGLHMSSTIIKNHFNGTLSVSNVAEGAEFLILLPISDIKDSHDI